MEIVEKYINNKPKDKTEIIEGASYQELLDDFEKGRILKKHLMKELRKYETINN